jgi:hypothetical protein
MRNRTTVRGLAVLALIAVLAGCSKPPTTPVNTPGGPLVQLVTEEKGSTDIKGGHGEGNRFSVTLPCRRTVLGQEREFGQVVVEFQRLKPFNPADPVGWRYRLARLEGRELQINPEFNSFRFLQQGKGVEPRSAAATPPVGHWVDWLGVADLDLLFELWEWQKKVCSTQRVKLSDLVR